MARVRIIGKRGRGHCAYCRDTFDASAHRPCSGCGVLLHAACRNELGGCTTLGCKQASEATQRVREEAREARQTGRERRLRVRERGRINREPPGSFARLGPYSRMINRTVWYVGLSLGLVALLLAGLANPGETLEFFTSPSVVSGLLKMLLALVLYALGGFMAYDWLSRLPRFWSRFDELLDDGEVTPMHFSTFTTGSIRSKTTWVRLSSPDRVREIRAGGFLPPFWLTFRSGQDVFVHGQDDDEPCVIEFPDGTLALVDPS